MSLTPFVFVDEPLAHLRAGSRCSLASEERHHLSTVLRLANGAELEVSDGAGYVTHARLFGGAVELIDTPTLRQAPRPEVVVMQAVPKGRKLDDVVRVLTELGVDHVQLIDGQRSVARMDARRQDGQLARLEAVCRAASRQARRPRLPVIAPPATVASLQRFDGVLAVAHPDDATASRPATSLLDLAQHAGGTAATVGVAIGPEGGWTDAEVDRFVELGGHIVSLGPTFLRTEHAGAAAVAVLMAGLGRWQSPSSLRAGRMPG